LVYTAGDAFKIYQIDRFFARDGFGALVYFMRSSVAGAWIDTGDWCDMIGCMRNGTGITMFIIALARRTAKRWTTFGGFFRFLEL
jgi:hypothetical protein